MKNLLAFFLVGVMIMGLFSGCKKEDPSATDPTGGSVAVDLNEPVAMVSFDPAGVPGVTLQEPADLTTAGTSETKTVSVLVGDNDGSYTVRTLKGVDAEMSFTLSGVKAGAPAMIDIEEIHQREDENISYYVYINDKQVYGRIYDPSSDGPNHCYFDVPADVVGDSGTLKVRIVSKCDGEIRFRRVWAISDPDKTAEEQGIAKKMDVVLMLNEVPSALNYTYLKSLVDSYKCSGMYNVGLCWEINHFQWGRETTEMYLNNVITASIQTGATLYLGINSWWGGTPTGMDGLGGSWCDVPYQQITYDKNNFDGRGTWQLTTPNIWSDTPWLSMNNDHYNQARVERIQETVAYLQQRTAELALAGQEIPAIHLYTENEPIYWPISWSEHSFDNYPEGVGDFSAYVIADAAADGVTLDPTDGLSEEETMWMYRNLNSYISQVGSAIADGAGYNYITIKDGEISYPSEQMVMDSYTHSPIQAFYPNWDDEQQAWENHVLSSIQFGGEWNCWLDDNGTRALDYLIAYGSFSNINAERSGFPGGGNGSNDFRVLSQCYAYGLEGVVIYNVLKDTDQQNVIDESTMGDSILTPRRFSGAPIYESDFTKKTSYGVNNTLVAMSGFRWEDTLIPNKAAGGSLTYKLKDAAQYGDGLQVDLSGQINEAARVEILVGSSADSMKSIGTYDTAVLSVSVDASEYAGAKDVYIGVRIVGVNMTTADLLGSYLNSVHISRAGITNGHIDGTKYTYTENRTRCQIIAARADTETLMKKFLERCGGECKTELQAKLYSEAFSLYAQGRYGEAYAAISQGISQLLPANFTVDGYGQLGQYPISLTVDGKSKITVCLKEISESGARFTMSASSDANVTVSFHTDSGKWSMKQESSGDWVIASGDVEAKDGKASFTVEMEERSGVDYPDEIEGRVQTPSGGLTFQTQDVAVSGYANRVHLNYGTDVKVYRGADGTPKEQMTACDTSDLQQDDYVQLKLNDRDQIVEIYAWYGTITGKVVKVEEISLEGEMSNAFVTVEAANGTTKRLEIGWDTRLAFTGATGERGKLALVERVGLTVGQQITVRYCPYTFNDRTRAVEITD